MSLTSLALKFAVPVPKVESFERYLFIGPHPDDIEIGAGATAAKLAAMGKTVCFLICTDGRFGDGHTELKGDQLIERRKQEALASAKVLGASDVRFLGLSDGACYTQEDLMRGIAQTIGDFQPDLVLAPDPCVTSECHADHLNVGEAARRIACAAPYPGTMNAFQAKPAPVQAIAYYMTAKPNRLVKTNGYFQKQLSSIFDCHTSQFPTGSAEAGSLRTYLQLRSIDFGLRSMKGRAEGFRLLTQTHMHCIPEAGN